MPTPEDRDLRVAVVRALFIWMLATVIHYYGLVGLPAVGRRESVTLVSAIQFSALFVIAVFVATSLIKYFDVEGWWNSNTR
ncbi:hypothetical protein [Haloarchaeobius sp. DT45]|uniref:hypothetical protein n=1 Tax=Haloarchaeobius sp. DT45 TaxID=3446116 RepID=UPI003F6D05BB